MKRQAITDTRSLMVTAGRLSRVERLTAAYDSIISQTDDIPTLRRLIHKRDAYRREVDKLKGRLRAVGY